MSVGIIGAGNIGQALAKQARSAGHEVTLANSRGPESLDAVVGALGAGVAAGTLAEAAACDFVALAVPWPAVQDVAKSVELNGKVLIDATNPLVMEPEVKLFDLGGKCSGEAVADMFPGARVVKAANTLFAAVLARDPAEAGGKRVLVISGDDAEAKEAVAGLFGAAGFATFDLGGLAAGGLLQDPGKPFIGKNLLLLGAARG